MNIDVRKLTRTSLLLALAIVFQMVGRAYPIASQFLVGPIVNTIFIICLFFNGLGWSLFIAMLTPILAWSLGQLPQPLGPIIPIIALGNISFILIFYLGKKFLRRDSIVLELSSLLCAAIIKFGVIFFGVKIVMQLINLVPQAAKAASKLMGINQFVTALAGGLIAVVLVKALPRRIQGEIQKTI